MNIVDLAIALFLLWFALNGYWKGFIREGLELVVTVIAFFVAFFAYHDFSRLIGGHFSLSTNLAKTVSFMAVFIAIIFLYRFLYIIFMTGYRRKSENQIRI